MEAFDAAERLSQSRDGGEILDDETRGAISQTARRDLDRIFLTGGVSALIGHTYGAVKDFGVYETGEAIRGLAKLEAEERDRCANFATKAIAAGIAERQVRIPRRTAGSAHRGRNQGDLGPSNLTPAQQAVAGTVVREELLALSARRKTSWRVLR